MTHCTNCHIPIDRPATVSAGECHACYYYRRRRNKPRPQELIGRAQEREPFVYACDPYLCPNPPTERRVIFGHVTRLCPACAELFDKM